MSQKNKNETESADLRAVTHSAALSEMVREEKEKLLEIALDITMGKEKNNQLKKAKKKRIARLLTRRNQLQILAVTSEANSEIQKKEQE